MIFLLLNTVIYSCILTVKKISDNRNKYRCNVVVVYLSLSSFNSLSETINTFFFKFEINDE